MKNSAKRVASVFFLAMTASWWNAGCNVESWATVASALEPEYTFVSESFEYTHDSNGKKNGGTKYVTYDIDDCADLSTVYDLAVEHSNAVGQNGMVPNATSTNDNYTAPTRTANDVQLPVFITPVKAGDLTVTGDGDEMEGEMVGPSKTKVTGANATLDEIPKWVADWLNVTAQNPPTPFWTVDAWASYTEGCIGVPEGKIRVIFIEDFTVTAQSDTAQEAIVDRHKDNFDFKGTIERALDNLPECEEPTSTGTSSSTSTGSSSSSTGAGGTGGSCSI